MFTSAILLPAATILMVGTTCLASPDHSGLYPSYHNSHPISNSIYHEQPHHEHYETQEHYNHNDYQPKPYHFQYGVHDDYHGTHFAQQEASDGKVVSGSYKVLLPDGRTQIVEYHADPHGYGGFVAKVSYEGQAVEQEHHHEPHQHPHHGGYKPAQHDVHDHLHQKQPPVYHPHHHQTNPYYQ